MNKIIFFIVLGIFNISLAQTTSDQIQGQFLVKFKEKQATKERVTNSPIIFGSKIEALHKELEVTSYINSFNEKQTYLIHYKSNISVNDAIKIYLKTGLFEYAEPNYIIKGLGYKTPPTFIPNDKHYSRQWYLNNKGDLFKPYPQLNNYAKKGADIEMEPAWIIEKGNPDLIIAIIDSGLKMDHPEFTDRIWENTDEIPNNGIDDDNNGYKDDVHGWNVIYNNNNPKDDQGHGTNCGGIMAATNNNNIGYAGINGKSKLMVVKVLDSKNRGSHIEFSEGIRYAVDNGAKVINLSLGTPQNLKSFEDTINYAYNKGAILIVATGNDNVSTKMYPAAYQNVIAVGATDIDDTRCKPYNRNHGGHGGSNYGDHIDIVAPGNYMQGLSYNNDYSYDGWFSGTSQAAPVVSGIVSLMISLNPNLSFEKIKQILEETAEDQVGRSYEDTPGYDIYHGHGRVNAYQALLRVQKTLGVKDIAFEDPNKTLIYPNPVKNDLFINSKSDVKNISIYSMLGQKIASKSNTKNLDLTELQGLFLAKITFTNGKTIVHELICE